MGLWFNRGLGFRVSFLCVRACTVCSITDKPSSADTCGHGCSLISRAQGSKNLGRRLSIAVLSPTP